MSLGIITAVLNIFSKAADYFATRQLLEAGKTLARAEDVQQEMRSLNAAQDVKREVDAMSNADKRKWLREHLSTKK